MMSADVLVVTREQETAAMVRSVLEGGVVSSTPSVCDSIMELRARLSRMMDSRPGVAFVDIDEDTEHVLFELSKTLARHPHIRFVALSKSFDEKLVLHAMQAGARHFLRKNAITAELDNVLERLLIDESQERVRLGAVTSVFSCSGGCGATTVAINLANELRIAGAERVLIVDMDQHYGSVAAYLGLKGRYGIGHVLARGGDIDRHLVESAAITHRQGIEVLLSPVSAEADMNTALDYGNLLAALEACRESYSHVIVDAPRIPSQTMADLASAGKVAVVVFQLTVRDVRFAGSMISFLTGQGIPRERILPVANRVRKRGGLLRLEEGRHAIGAAGLFSIRSDWRKAIRSTNQGLPLSEVAKRSGLRRDYRRLADRVRHCTANGSQ